MAVGYSGGGSTAWPDLVEGGTRLVVLNGDVGVDELLEKGDGESDTQLGLSRDNLGPLERGPRY